MSDNKNKQLDMAKGARTDLVRSRNTGARSGSLEFIKDLLTGFTALLLFLFVIFICLPLLMIALKIGVVIAIPLLYFGVFIICIAFLGRLIRILVLKKR